MTAAPPPPTSTAAISATSTSPCTRGSSLAAPAPPPAARAMRAAWPGTTPAAAVTALSTPRGHGSASKSPARPSNAPTIHILAGGTLNHEFSTGGSVQPLIDQTGGTIADDSTGGTGLVLANPNGTNTDLLSGTLRTLNGSAQIQLGATLD